MACSGAERSAKQCYSPRIRRAESVTFVFPLTERMPPVVATRSRSIQPSAGRVHTRVQMENSLRRARLYRGLICPRRRVCPEWPGGRIRYGGGAGRSTNSAVRWRLPFVLRRRGNGNVVASKNRSVAFRNESRCACYGAFRKADTVCVLLGCHHDAATLEVLRPHRPPLLSTRACRVACKGTARRSSISGRL